MKKDPCLTVARAASLAKLDRKTLARRLNETGAQPDKRGLFTLAQVFNALLGGVQDSRARKVRAEAELAELLLARERNEVLSAENVLALWREAIAGLRDVITHADVPLVTRHQLLKQLREIPLSEYAPAPEAAPATR